MKNKLLLITSMIVLILVCNISVIMASDCFNTENINKGIIHVTSNDGGKLKVMIQNGEKKYTYDQDSTGKTESFPLQLGNGTYKISLFKNTSGSSYKLLASTSVELNLADPNSVFLTSVQNINWKVDSKAVAKAVEMTKDTENPKKKANILWNYMVKNNKYDYKKLSTLSTGYIPVVDQTFVDKQGICYDFSALYAAMLRSQGTPVKLVKGYAPKNASGYHAWNEVYDANKGKWIIIDSTYDLQVITKNPKVSMEKNTADFNKIYEY